ncbi:MAG: ComEC/Rec2 family competence protein [Oscillospiraceae bacterium]
MARKSKKINAAAVIFICIATFLAILYGNSDKNENENASSTVKTGNTTSQVHFIDVGQGDSALITSEGKNILVDTGERDSSNKLINYLNGIKSEQGGEFVIDYLIITHPHTDHMGEAADVLKAFEVKNIIMPKVASSVTPTNSTYKYFLQTVKSQGKKITAAKNDSFEFGSGKIEMFTPEKQYSDLNSYSTLVKFTDGDSSFLITGDCDFDEEDEILGYGYDLSAKVLKVGHHGSRSSSGNSFLKAVSPRYAVISCGEGNSYGHPHKQLLNRLKKYVSEDNIFITMNDGNIIFTTDGGKTLTADTDKSAGKGE